MFVVIVDFSRIVYYTMTIENCLHNGAIFGSHMFDNQNQQVAEVKGNWKGWDFKFISKQGREIGSVTKKWAGLGKELFTSADNYIISLKDLSGASPAAGALLLAAGLAIDVVYKEGE